MRPDYDNNLEYLHSLNKIKYQDKKLWSLTFRGLREKLNLYLESGWVIKDRITTARIGYKCKVSKRI